MITITNWYGARRSFKLNLFIFSYATRVYKDIGWYRETKIKCFGLVLFSKEKSRVSVEDL